MHTIRDRKSILQRIRRIRGQVDALERAMTKDHDCTEILQQVAACRGAISGLMAHLLDGHIREHIIDSARAPTKSEVKALDELLAVIKTYVK